MVKHGNAAVNVTEEIVMKVRKTSLVGKPLPSEASHLKEGAKEVFERRYPALEVVERLLCPGLELALTVEQKALYTLLCLLWRQVGERDEVLAFEVDSLRHKLLTAFFVDERRNNIREG